MSRATVDLTTLLVAVPAVAKTELEALGEAEYRRRFLNFNEHSGALMAHDGATVKFFADRYHHAFHTSHDRARQAYAKDTVAAVCIARMPWIQPMIEGLAADTECWEVPLKVPEEGIRCFPGKRAYVSWKLGYIVWLEPLRKGGFKFSSAYPVPTGEIQAYLKRARKIWP